MRRAGFTLIEMIIFVAIFAVTMAAFMAIFINVSSVQVGQAAQAEVQTQSQFILQTVQYYVERSSEVQIAANTPTTTLELRMSSSTEDPVFLTLNGTGLQLQVGSAAPQIITSNRVTLSNLSFVKGSNPGGHDVVSVAFTVSYATNNIKQAFTQSLQTAVARVSAATFDSNVVPSLNGTYNLGTAAVGWTSINQALFFNGSNVGVGTSPAATTPLEVAGGNIYVASSTAGIILKNGTNCYVLSITASGALATSTLTCP